MPRVSDRISRERKTIRHMIRIHCGGRHGTGGHLCAECRQLLEYAMSRIDRCPYGNDKPTCARCPVHCYKPAMREKIRQVMRYAGPRMLVFHPLLTLLHFSDELRRPGKVLMERKQCEINDRE